MSFFRLSATHFSLLVQREVSKRKHPLSPAPLRGSLRCSASRGRSRTRRPIGASNKRSLLSPWSPALLGAYQGSRASQKQRPHLAARGAVLSTYPPLGSAEKRSAEGVWKRPTVRTACRTVSSAASPSARASQSSQPQPSPWLTAPMGCVSLVAFFAQAKKVTPAGGDLNSMHGCSSPSKAHGQKSPLSLTLSHKGRGDHARSK